jgi:RNA polymerase sigma factor (sigma-70 family)
MSYQAGTEARFTQTHWSLILTAKAGESGAELALDELCRKYWYPVYAFLRRQAQSPQDAQDLTQGFFTHLLRRDWLGRVGPEKGKFRTFLLACLRNYIHNQRERDLGPTRNPGHPLLSIDAQEAERRYHQEPCDVQDPSKLFERRWAFTLIGEVLRALQAEWAQQGKAGEFALLHPFLTGDAERGGYAAAASQMGMTEGAVRVAATRLRTEFRSRLREEIARTVEHPEDVEGEIAHLFEIFMR